MIYNLATPEQPGFSYLYLFKEDWYPSMANECKKSPTVHRVVEIVIQNPHLHKEMLADYKVKSIRFGEMQTFTIEILDKNDWEPIEEEWFEVKNLLFFIGKHFQTYKFM